MAPSTTRTSSFRTSTRAAPTRRSSIPKDLPAAIVEKAKNWKIRGSSGKLNIALDGLPEFPALGKDNPLAYGDMHFLDSLEKMERAYDDWKNGTWSKEPYLDLLIRR
jgi:phytoene dehydrogenase-like protein